MEGRVFNNKIDRVKGNTIWSKKYRSIEVVFLPEEMFNHYYLMLIRCHDVIRWSQALDFLSRVRNGS